MQTHGREVAMIGWFQPSTCEENMHQILYNSAKSKMKDTLKARFTQGLECKLLATKVLCPRYFIFKLLVFCVSTYKRFPPLTRKCDLLSRLVVLVIFVALVILVILRVEGFSDTKLTTSESNKTCTVTLLKYLLCIVMSIWKFPDWGFSAWSIRPFFFCIECVRIYIYIERERDKYSFQKK